MTDVACVMVPLKTSSELDFAKKAVQFGQVKKWHTGVLDKMSKKRALMLKAFAERREVDKAVEEYMAYVVALTEDGRANFLRKIVFYYWAAALGPRTSHAASDSHYEVASVLSNLGLYHMEVVTQNISTSNRASAERIEKESYKTLCIAAGFFDKSFSLMSGFGSKIDGAFPLDMQPSMISGLRDICLAQAQELSLSKALRNTDNRGRELLAKLASKSYALFSSALVSFKEQRPKEEPSFVSFMAWASLKKEILLVKTYLLMALHYTKADKMAEAFSASKQAEQFMPNVSTLFNTHKKVLDKTIAAAVKLLEEECQRVAYKIKRDTEMLGRPKLLDEPVPLVEPQELARAVPYTYPEHSVDWTPEVIQTFELKD